MRKKLVMSTVAVLALTTSLSANFSFGDMFTDMKDASTSMSHDAKDVSKESPKNNFTKKQVLFQYNNNLK